MPPVRPTKRVNPAWEGAPRLEARWPEAPRSVPPTVPRQGRSPPGEPRARPRRRGRSALSGRGGPPLPRRVVSAGGVGGGGGGGGAALFLLSFSPLGRSLGL